MSRTISENDVEAFVLRWQVPVHNLAFRMLRDPGAADDLTWEVMARAARKLDQLKPGRDPKPWIYRLATNAILNHIRGAKTRRAREAAGARPAGVMGDEMDRKATELAVQAEVRALPDQARALVALRFYSGLTQRELAQVLDKPRSTVQSQLEAALNALRVRLSEVGLGAAVPALEMTLSNTPLVPPSPSLEQRLRGLAASSSSLGAVGVGAVTTSAVTAGALTAYGCVLVLLGAVAGYWVRGLDPAQGTQRIDSEQGREHTPPPGLVGSGTPGADSDAGGPSTTSPTTVSNVSPSVPASLDGARAEVQGAQAKRAPDELDWKRFSQLLAKNRTLFAANHLGRAADLTPAQRARGVEFVSEVMQLMELAHARSNSPTTDPDIFSGATAAFFDSVLTPGPEVRSRLKAVAVKELRMTFGTLDASRTLPVRSRFLRGEVTDRVAAWVKGVVPEDKLAGFGELMTLQPSLLGGGNYFLLEVGVGLPPEPSARAAPESLVEVWRGAFGLSEAQLVVARHEAERLVDGMKFELRRRALDREDATISDGEQEALDTATRLLQLEAEDRIAQGLTAEQFEKARKSGPVLFRFYWGHGEELSDGFGGL